MGVNQPCSAQLAEIKALTAACKLAAESRTRHNNYGNDRTGSRVRLGGGIAISTNKHVHAN